MERFPTPFGTTELTDERERHIFKFHPDVRLYRKRFAKTLAKPDIIRRSKHDSSVLILYQGISKEKYLAIVTKTNHRNFIITAYLTYKIQHQPS